LKYKQIRKEFFKDYKQDLEHLNPALINLRVQTLVIRIQTIGTLNLRTEQDEEYRQLCMEELALIEEFRRDKELKLDRIS